MIVRYTNEEFENAKSADKLALECESCGEIFYAEKKQIKFELRHNRGRLKYCSVECSNDSHHKEHHVLCEKCGKEITVVDSVYKASKTKHFFCSKSCAAKYNNSKRGLTSEGTKKKIKDSVIKYYEKLRLNDSTKTTNEKKRQLKTYKCVVCGKEYNFQRNGGCTKKCCSEECSKELKSRRKEFLSKDTIKRLSAAGRHSVSIQSKNRRSKNEKYFCELCEKHFKAVKHNEPIFNGWDADIIIEDVKIAVLWNGKWHYQKIKENHSVEQVQNRDKIKILEIGKCGYKPYVIKDMGKYDPQFVEKEFDKFVNFIRGE